MGCLAGDVSGPERADGEELRAMRGGGPLGRDTRLCPRTQGGDAGKALPQGLGAQKRGLRLLGLCV